MTVALKQTTVANQFGASSAIDPSRIKIGPDVLELVSTAMYIDPRTLFREYIQNAADAIDTARANNMLAPDEGTVHIEIDRAGRNVRIWDDGTGLDPERFAETMTALGGSTKRGTAARGFRGVGRLAGLGYTRELTFRSRVSGGQVSVLTWDCRRLRALLRNASESDNLPSLIAACTTAGTEEATGEQPDRFFEVEMRGVARLRNDVLLNSDIVRAYIAEVCPVPFSDAFSHRDRISTHLQAHVATADLRVLLDDDPEPITRPHRDYIELPDGRALALEDVETIELYDRDGRIGAVGWIAHHNYDGAVPSPMQVRGMRLRLGNVQIGEHDLFEDLFKEARFNSWVVGELHVVDPKVIPNARRDHFEQNMAWGDLANQFLPIARALSDRCRLTSIQRNWGKRFDLALRQAEDGLDAADRNEVGRVAMLEKVRTSLDECDRIRRSPNFRPAESKGCEALLVSLRDRLKHASLSSGRLKNDDPYRLDGLPENLRPIYANLFALIERHGRDTADPAELVRMVRDSLDKD